PPKADGGYKRLNDKELADLEQKPKDCLTPQLENGIPILAGGFSECILDKLGLQGVTKINQADGEARGLLRKYLKSHGALAAIGFRNRVTGQDGLLFPATGEPVRTGEGETLPSLSMETEDYIKLVRLVESGIKVRLELDS